MIELPSTILEAVASFQKLPGVGEKTAQRQIIAMTKWNAEELNTFAHSIANLTNLRFYQECGMFSEGDICNICKTESRKTAKTLCVVENINDLMAVEKSNTFGGVSYFRRSIKILYLALAGSIENWKTG